MDLLVANILRSSISTIMNMLMLFSLAQPKYGKKVMTTAMVSFMLMDVLSSIYFYLAGSLTALAKFDILLFLVIGFAAKPFFRDNMMQWLFNYITSMNVYIAILILSYVLSRFLPFPMYANTLLRFIFFAAVILLFRRYMRPLYREVVEHWNIFFYLVVGILMNFGYYIFHSNDITKTIKEDFIPLFLLIILSVVTYVTVFYFLKKTSTEYELRAENIRNQMQQELLNSELAAYEDFVSISKQNRHDLRHHNAILTEYLAQGDMDGAKAYLRHYDESIAETVLYQYCQNPTANAILRLYERRTKDSGITFAANAELPDVLLLSAPEMGVLLSNILENAYEACIKSERTNCFLSFSAETDEQNLKMELHNSVSETVQFKDGLPLSTKKNGGTGTKSVARIVKKCGGMIRFKQQNDMFITQIVLPLL